MFTIVVHGATVLSTIVVFRKDIALIIRGFFEFRWNADAKYIVKIIISMIPVAIIGLCFKDAVREIFNNANIILIVGFMLLIREFTENILLNINEIRPSIVSFFGRNG